MKSNIGTNNRLRKTMTRLNSAIGGGRLLVFVIIVLLCDNKVYSFSTKNPKASVSTNGGGSPTTSHAEQQEKLKISFVTGNKMKARELNKILTDHEATRINYSNDPTTMNGDDSKYNTSLVDLRILSVDLPEIQEVNTEAIAKEKAALGAQLANGPCVVEDTSLQFHALGGMPGPYIKWFQDSLGCDGLYNILAAYPDKSATAVCTLAFCPYPHADPVLFTGSTTGKISNPEVSCSNGFGWDTIFIPDGSEETFSCMTLETKNSFSHRGKAVRKWAEWLGHNHQELLERQNGRKAIGHQGLDFKTWRSV